MTSVGLSNRTYFGKYALKGRTLFEIQRFRIDSAGSGRAISHDGRHILAVNSGGVFEKWAWDDQKDPIKVKSQLLSLTQTNRGLCTDGRYFYLNFGGTFQKRDLATPTSTVAPTSFTGGGNFGFAFDGRFLFTCQRNSALVRKYDLDGNQEDSFSVASTPIDLVADGRHLWVYRNFKSGLSNARFVTKYDYEGNTRKEYTVEPTTNSGGADSITCDGRYLILSYRRFEV
jgi:hypothetical protein